MNSVSSPTTAGGAKIPEALTGYSALNLDKVALDLECEEILSVELVLRVRQAPGAAFNYNVAAEITAVTGADPGVYYRKLAAEFGAPCYTRIDAPASPAQNAAFKQLTGERVTAETLARDPIVARLTHAIYPLSLRGRGKCRRIPFCAGTTGKGSRYATQPASTNCSGLSH